MNFLIFGPGWMGNKFLSQLTAQGQTVILSRANITDELAVLHEIRTHEPDFVLNCAGKKGTPNVDWCETHKEETFNSNVLGPMVLKKACEQTNTFLVHLSTGCIYDGDNGGKGWSEKDPPNYFGSFYSRTKAMAEDLLSDGNVLLLRLRMPISYFPEPGNLVTKLVKYRRIISVANSISIVDDFVRASIELMLKRKKGIYNVTNPGVITHAQVLDLYKEIIDPSFSYSLMSTQELAIITRTGRCNCIMDTSKLQSEGIKLPNIHDAVRNVLVEYKTHLAKPE